MIKNKIYRENKKNEEKYSESLKKDEPLIETEDMIIKSELKYKTFECLSSEITKINENSHIQLFMLCMTLCNHYFPNENLENISNDEKALVLLADELGVILYERTVDNAVLKIDGKEYIFDILGTYGLFSELKYNKIIIKNRKTKEVILFVKGNTQSVLKLFSDQEDILTAEECLKSVFLNHLRKIVFGYKILTPDEENAFVFDYKTAKLSPINTEGRISNLFEKYEAGLSYLGIIGVENVIKQKTRDTIAHLSRAGIKT